MRIVIPFDNGQIAADFTAAVEFMVYEDDHGRINNRYSRLLASPGSAAVLALLEDIGADVFICASMDEQTRLSIARAGIMPFTDTYGASDAAALDFLSTAVAADPANTCNACGHNGGCSLDCASCSPSQQK